MKHGIASLSLGVVSMAAAGQSVDLPPVKAGDTWAYQTVVETGTTGWTKTENELTVSRVSATTIYYSVKQSGSTQPPREAYASADWSRLRNVNGKETVVAHPMSFPLAIGKTWDLTYTEQHPNKRHRFEQWDHKYVVLGYENVDVPAGKFKALKIESEGHWNAELEPKNEVAQGAVTSNGSTTMVTQVQHNGAEPSSGRTYKAIWYVPEVKRWVKSVEEYYGSNGVRSERYTEELTAFKPGE